METPEEKAKRLGVPLLTEHIPAGIDSDGADKLTDEFRDLKYKVFDMILKHGQEIVCVCSCGKEISRAEYANKMKCGSPHCPFGYETN